MADKLRILVISRSYPSAANLYQYPFVHRRVRAYQALGHEVVVFRPTDGPCGTHLFDGVECTSGQADALDRLAGRFRPEVLAIHGLGPTLWPIVEGLAQSVPMAAWLHGSEIPGFLKRKSALDRQPAEIADALLASCCDFWRTFLRDKSAAARLVFPSRTAVAYAEEELGIHLDCSAVISNPIDTGLFPYTPKKAEDRFNVLFLRPFDSRAYGNDLAVAAICRLRALPGFDRFSFRMIGDGPLFDETLAPVRDLPNVTLHQGFLTQQQIAAEHQRSGVFLVPTRLDTQGVSRDEAMSSGLVPVTNAIDAVCEFVDGHCASLVPADDPDAMAAALMALAADPDGFLRKSRAAAERIGSTRSSARIIPQDLQLMAEIIAG